MINLDLKKKTGLPIYIKENNICSKDFCFSQTVNYTLADIRKHLINRNVNCPTCFYSRFVSIDHEGFFKEKGIKLNFYLLQPGVAGIEYIKTHCYLLKSYPKIIEISHGSGIVMMQNVKNDKIYIVKVKEGQKVIVPPNFKLKIINTKLYTPLIACEIYSYAARNFLLADEQDEIPYYVISKNSKPAIVLNPDFINVEKYYRIKPDKFDARYNLSSKLPIVKQLLRKYDKFNWLFEKNINIYF